MKTYEPGVGVAEFICDWVERNTQVAAIKLFRARITPPLHGGYSPEDNVILRKAVALKKDVDLPFWDATLIYAAQPPLGSQQLFERLLLHNSSNRGVVHVSRQDLSVSFLGALMENLDQEELLVLSSRVQTLDDKEAFIPMLDFHRKADIAGLNVVERVLRALSKSGAIFESGKSYHFYGDGLLNEAEQRVFLAQSLLFGPIVDRAWIAHQLIEGECGLRLSVRQDYGAPPMLIKQV